MMSEYSRGGCSSGAGSGEGRGSSAAGGNRRGRVGSGYMVISIRFWY